MDKMAILAEKTKQGKFHIDHREDSVLISTAEILEKQVVLLYFVRKVLLDRDIDYKWDAEKWEKRWWKFDSS